MCGDIVVSVQRWLQKSDSAHGSQEEKKTEKALIWGNWEVQSDILLGASQVALAQVSTIGWPRMEHICLTTLWSRFSSIVAGFYLTRWLWNSFSFINQLHDNFPNFLGIIRKGRKKNGEKRNWSPQPTVTYTQVTSVLYYVSWNYSTMVALTDCESSQRLSFYSQVWWHFGHLSTEKDFIYWKEIGIKIWYQSVNSMGTVLQSAPSIETVGFAKLVLEIYRCTEVY